MNGYGTPQYQAGYKAGLNADQPFGAFEMSQFVDDYVLGYVVGYSEIVSFRQALPVAWAWQAGELGRLYRVPLRDLAQFIGPEDFDGSMRRALRESYNELDDNDLPDDDDGPDQY